MADRLEILVYTPVMNSLNHCGHCQIFLDEAGVGGQVHEQDLSQYPKEFADDYKRLSDWITGLARRYPAQVVIKVIDPGSPQGLWQSIRHGIRTYPTFLVGRDKHVGWDEAGLDSLIRQKLIGSS